MDDPRQALESYIHAHIPLTRAMQVSVAALEEDLVTLAAPLLPNINHRDTVFGGSASALCILSAWSLIHAKLGEERIHARIVIQNNSMDYLLPAADRFEATCSRPDPASWNRFIKGLQLKRAGRIHLNSTLTSQGKTCGKFEGAFVALLPAAE